MPASPADDWGRRLPASVGAAMRAGQAAGVDRLDAQLLLGRRLGQTRTWLVAHPEAPLTPEIAAGFLDDLARRSDDVPLAYLLGEREFRGLSLTVSSAVLVPRADTEVLVDWALELLHDDGALAAVEEPTVIDLGTGSGAIALAIRHACPRARVIAIDASPASIDVAQANASRLGLPIDCRLGDWLAAVAPASADLIVSNPPYVAAGDPHLTALRHEPISALVAGTDGLDDLRRIAATAPDCLRPGGWLLLEHGWNQAAGVRELLGPPLVGAATRQDLAGLDRCSGARRPAVV